MRQNAVSIKEVKELMGIACRLGIEVIYSEKKLDRCYLGSSKSVTINVDSRLPEIYNDLYEKIEAAGGNPLEGQNGSLYGYWLLLKEEEKEEEK